LQLQSWEYFLCTAQRTDIALTYQFFLKNSFSGLSLALSYISSAAFLITAPFAELDIFSTFSLS
jgi:hypothetical protein